MAAKQVKKHVNLEAEARTEWEKQKVQPHFWIEFQKAEDETLDEVSIGCAGVKYRIKYGEIVPVPKAVIDVLKHAVTETFEYVERNDRMFRRRVRRVRFPYSMHIEHPEYGPPTPENVLRFKADQNKRARIPDLEPADRSDDRDDFEEARV